MPRAPITRAALLCALALASAALRTRAAAASAGAVFPADAGAINVRDYGAVGDGSHDDTQAFIDALQASSVREESWHVRIVQVPAGTYRITDTLVKRYREGGYNAGFVLVGAGESRTVLRLDDHAAAFQDPSHPKAVIYTTGKGVAQAPKGGYALRGEGNDAFSNFVEDLTVNTGAGNPGAIGIDYLASNQGALRQVTVTGSGHTGVALTRPWFGPGLLQNVTVEGFETGIDVGSLNASVTMDGIRLSGQAHTGLRNSDNLVSVHDLTVHTGGNAEVVPVSNTTAPGMVVIDGASIEGGGTAVSNAGMAYLRDVRFTGAATALGQPVSANAPLEGVYRGGTRLADASPPWHLQAAAEPLSPPEPASRWVSAATYLQGAAPGDTGIDVTAALKAAFASGAHTVYLPFGVYVLTADLDVPSSVQHIVGMNSTIVWRPTGNHAADAAPSGLLRTHNTGPLLIEKLVFSFPAGHHVAVEVSGTGPVVLRDIVGLGALFTRDATGGPLWLNDISGGFLLQIAGRSPVWGIQVDTEGGGARGGLPSVRITNNGAAMWLLGLKSEGNNTLVAASGGAVTDILGVLCSPLGSATMPLFQASNAQLSATGLELAWTPAATYRDILQQIQGASDSTLDANQFPPRPQTQGIFLPRVITSD